MKIGAKLSMGLLVVVGGVGLILTKAGFTQEQGKKVEFPENYRQWHYVKSMVIQKGHPLYSIVPGLHHVYANDAAFQHFKSGSKQPYPEGSAFVLELLDVNKGKSAITATNRKLILVKRKSPQYRQPGGWGWELFTMPDRQRGVNNPDSQCANCHYRSEETHDGIWIKLEDVKGIVE